MRSTILFIILACYADTYCPETLPVLDRIDTKVRQRLELRGGSPDLGLSNLDGDMISSHMNSLRALKDLTAGVRDGKYSAKAAKQRAEHLIMGSNPIESLNILEVNGRTTRHRSQIRLAL